MKILTISPLLDGTNGWSTNAINIIHGLESLGNTVISVTPAGAGAGTHPIVPAAMKLYAFPWLAPLAAWRVRNVIRKEQPDVVHIIAEPYALLTPFFGKALRKKVVLTLNGTYAVFPLRQRILRWFAKHYYKNLHCFICISKFTQQAVSQRLGTIDTSLQNHFDQHSHVLHIGIKLPPTPQFPRNLSDPVKQIVFVGGLKLRKGVLEAIEACGAFKNISKTPFILNIVGSTTEATWYVEEVQKRIRDLGLQDQVRVLGTISASELEQQYQQADLFLLPSITDPDNFEGFGIVFIEANAYGVPCIGPDTSGAAEAISEGISGYRVNPADAAAMAERMRWILDEGRISAEQCRAWAEEHDTLVKAKELLTIYAKCVA